MEAASVARRARVDVHALADEFDSYVKDHLVHVQGIRVAIVVFVDSGYTSTLANFLVSMYKIQIRNMVLVCLDDSISSFAESIGVSCFNNHEVKSHAANFQGALWEFRIQILHRLVAQGVSVVLTDADAIWKKNPLDLLLEGDITASRGSFPSDSKARLGATGCMGFIFFRGSPKVAEFVSHGMLSSFSGDDQIALNHALEKYHVKFEEGTLTYTESTSASFGNAEGLRVVFLDHARFQRICTHDNEGAYVMHCFSQKTGNSKENSFKEHGLWYLRDAWDSITVPLAFADWVARVSQ